MEANVHPFLTWLWKAIGYIFLAICAFILFCPLLLDLLKTGPYL